MNNITHSPTAHALARLAIEGAKQFPHRSLECRVAAAADWIRMMWKRPVTDADCFSAEDILWRTTNLG